MPIYIGTINNIYSGEKSYYGNSTIFYLKGNRYFHVVQNRDFPILPGDEVTISSIRRTSTEGKRFYYVSDIFLTNNNFRKLPKITKDNTKTMSFIGYKKSKHGIVLIIGYAFRLITPNNPDFENYLLRPLRWMGESNLPKFDGDILKFLTELRAIAPKYTGTKIRIKLKYRNNLVNIDDGNYILPIN